MILSETIPMLASFRANRTPDREAIYDFDKDIHYTYKDMDVRSDKLAWFLTEKLGLKKGDRMGFITNTSVAMYDCFYASCKTGIIITTYNGRLRPEELIGLVENEEPQIIFFNECYRQKVAYLRNNTDIVKHYICMNDIRGEENEYCYEDIMAITPDSPVKYVTIDPEEPQMFVHTGGTTGIPKAAVLSFRCIFMNAIAEILTWQLNWEDSAYIAMPLYHTGGWNLLSLPLLMMGGRLILAEEFAPAKMLAISQQERPTIFMGVEAMLKGIAMHPEFLNTDLSCYKWMINGGAPISREALAPYWDRGIRVLNGYGMTETGPNNLTPNPDMPLETNKKKVNTVGKPFMFNRVRLVDTDGNDVPRGERGELIWRGEMTFSRYWNNPEDTAKVIDADGWIHSGDVGYQDEDGDIYICGRLKNMYISGGENIFPPEIEGVINQHPDVIETCVIGVPDSQWGEVGKALIVKKPGSDLTGEALAEWIKGNLSTIKRPKYIQFVDEIPKNAVGKRNQSLIAKLYGSVWS